MRDDWEVQKKHQRWSFIAFIAFIAFLLLALIFVVYAGLYWSKSSDGPMPPAIMMSIFLNVTLLIYLVIDYNYRVPVLWLFIFVSWGITYSLKLLMPDVSLEFVIIGGIILIGLPAIATILICRTVRRRRADGFLGSEGGFLECIYLAFYVGGSEFGLECDGGEGIDIDF